MYQLLVLIFCLGLSTAYADGIYKHVDEDGNVSYSATPPADSENVEALDPIPDASDEELKAAHERQQKLQSYLDESASKRARREAAKLPANLGDPYSNNTLPNFPPVAGH